MNQTILIPIDGFESVDKTLFYVQSISAKTKTLIELLHVTPNVNAFNTSIDNIAKLVIE